MERMDEGTLAAVLNGDSSKGWLIKLILVGCGLLQVVHFVSLL